MKRRPGLSMLEVVFAMVIVALAFGPVFTMLNTTTRISKTSLYELMAINYASEIIEQVQEMDVAAAVVEIRKKTGNPSLSTADILQENTFRNALNRGGPHPLVIPLQHSGKTSKAAFVLSPLILPMKERLIEVHPLVSPSADSEPLLDVRVIIKWDRIPHEDTGKATTMFSIVVKGV